MGASEKADILRIKGFLEEGLKAFQLGEYFKAHEAWEEAWRELGGAGKLFWQAMILLCVGAHHFKNQNMGGARNTWKKALSKCKVLRSQGSNEQITLLDALLQECLRLLDAKQDPVPTIAEFARNRISRAWID